MSTRRLWLVTRQELTYQLSRPSFWIMLVLAAAYIWSVSAGYTTLGEGSGDSSVGGKKAFLTSEFAVAQIIASFSFLVLSLFGAIAAGLAVIRDLEWKTGELLHATPLSPLEYLGGKLAGVLGAFLLALGLVIGLTVLFFQLLPNGEMAAARGPFLVRNYAVPPLMLAVPLVVFVCGTAFAIGTATRRSILVFLLPVILLIVSGFFLWTWAPPWLDPRIDRLLGLLDPSGYRWLAQTWLRVDRGVDFYNHQPIRWDPGFVLSRAVLGAIDLLSATLAGRHFARRLRSSGRVPKASEREMAATTPLPSGDRLLETLGMAARPPGLCAGLRIVARAELAQLASSPGLYLFIPVIATVTLSGNLVAVDEFGTPLLLTSGALAVRTMGTLITLLALLVLFYAVESLERERTTGFSTIHDALPIRAGSILAGKAVALSIVVFLTIAAVFIGAVGAIMVQGRVPIELAPFGIVWGLLLLPGIIMWASFVFAAYGLTKNRYATLGVVLAAFAATVYFGNQQKLDWLTNWPLWDALRWSDISTFELDRRALVLNRLFVLSLAVGFARFAVRHYPRRAADPTSLLNAVRWPAVARTARRAVPWIALPVVFGALIRNEINIGPDGPRARKDAKDYWVKNVATWTDAPIPAITYADIKLMLEPSKRAWEVEGRYLLVNPHQARLPAIPVTVGDWDDVRWTVNGKTAVPDTASHLFVFPVPLQPGDTAALGFHYRGVQRGSTRRGGGASRFILPSGVVIHSFDSRWFPVIGYDAAKGVGPENRAEPKQLPDDYDEGITPPAFGTGIPMNVRLAVTVPDGFTTTATGEKISETTSRGVTTTVWQTEHRVLTFNVLAGRYATRRGDGTAVYYDRRHEYNVDEIVRALDAARRYYGAWFAPFPWKELRLTEFPGLATYAQGFATNIAFSEQLGFLTKSDPRTQLAFFVTAHEAAHQWWPNIVLPAKGPSFEILSESMAHFSTALLIAEARGELAGMEFRRFMESRYKNLRRSDAERPLAKYDGSRAGDLTVRYDKGGFVLWMLSDLIGRERSLTALREFVANYRENPDHPSLNDFLRHLRRIAPDTAAYDEFAKQWFGEVIVPEYRLSNATTIKVTDGWETSAQVDNIGTGRMPVEVAVTAGERSPEPGRPTYEAARTTIVLGANERRDVTIRSGFRPERIVVDPDVRILQLRRQGASLELPAKSP